MCVRKFRNAVCDVTICHVNSDVITKSVLTGPHEDHVQIYFLCQNLNVLTSCFPSSMFWGLFICGRVHNTDFSIASFFLLYLAYFQVEFYFHWTNNISIDPQLMSSCLLVGVYMGGYTYAYMSLWVFVWVYLFILT